MTKNKTTNDLFIDAEKTYKKEEVQRRFEEIMNKKLNNKFISAGTLIRFRDACIEQGKLQTEEEELELFKTIEMKGYWIEKKDGTELWVVDLKHIKQVIKQIKEKEK
jgi:hypothetical protein